MDTEIHESNIPDPDLPKDPRVIRYWGEVKKAVKYGRISTVINLAMIAGCIYAFYDVVTHKPAPIAYERANAQAGLDFLNKRGDSRTAETRKILEEEIARIEASDGYKQNVIREDRRDRIWNGWVYFFVAVALGGWASSRKSQNHARNANKILDENQVLIDRYIKALVEKRIEPPKM